MYRFIYHKGHNDDDNETLQRIWNRGRKFYKRRLDNDVFRKKKEIGTFTCIEDDCPKDTSHIKKPNLVDRPMTAIYLRPDTAVVLDKSVVHRRPFTSVDRRSKQNISDTNLSMIRRSQSMELETVPKREDPNAPCEELPKNTVSVSPEKKQVTVEGQCSGPESNTAQNSTDQLDSTCHTTSTEKKLKEFKQHQVISKKTEGDPKENRVDETRTDPVLDIEDLTDCQDQKSIHSPSSQKDVIESSTSGEVHSTIENENYISSKRNVGIPVAHIQIGNCNETFTQSDKRDDNLTINPTTENCTKYSPLDKTESTSDTQIKGMMSLKGIKSTTTADTVTSSGANENSVLKTTKKRVKRRPSTAGGFLRTMLDSPKTSTGRALSAKPSGARTKTTNAGIGSMFDDDEFQISLLDFQRFIVHSANYESRVKNYAERIKSLNAEKTRAMDYYTIKLQSQTAKCRKIFKMEAAGGATDEDIKRATGNLSIKSLTLKTVDSEFQLNSSSYKNVPHL